jgi:hypothetical protein
MNLFEINSQLAVKLNQQFDTLYNLEYSEYSLLLKIIKDGIEKKNETIITQVSDIPSSPIKVNLPKDLRLK